MICVNCGNEIIDDEKIMWIKDKPYCNDCIEKKLVENAEEAKTMLCDCETCTCKCNSNSNS